MGTAGRRKPGRVAWPIVWQSDKVCAAGDFVPPLVVRMRYEGHISGFTIRYLHYEGRSDRDRTPFRIVFISFLDINAGCLAVGMPPVMEMPFGESANPPLVVRICPVKR